LFCTTSSIPHSTRFARLAAPAHPTRFPHICYLSPTTFGGGLPPNPKLTAATSADVDASALARARAIAAASTLEDVISCVPLAFQAALATPLRDLASTARKMCAARNIVRKYDALAAKGQVPSSIRQKEPVLQMSKEFAETESGKALVRKALADHKAYIDALFKQLRAAKTEELQELSSLLAPEKVCPHRPP